MLFDQAKVQFVIYERELKKTLQQQRRHSLKERKPVIINLEDIDAETARKIFDFLIGATYALNGNVQKIANNIFVFAPDNVDISASAKKPTEDFEFETMDTDTWR